MSNNSAIEWTDATWNPTVGCSIVSAGCTNCYAMKAAHGLERRFGSEKYSGLTKVVNGNPVWTGSVRLDEAALLQPLKWKRGRRIFVNSMSDLFHEDLPDEAIDCVFAVMALCPQHTFQVLTKRAQRMHDYFIAPFSAPNVKAWQARVCAAIDDLVPLRTDPSRAAKCALIAGPLPNVWLGVSAERQQEADERIPHLLATPAAVRFVSCEPLLGPINLTNLPITGSDLNALTSESCITGNILSDYAQRFAALNWVIVGGESGPHARPMHPQWARDIRDQCAASEVPFFFKQWGEWGRIGDQRPAPDHLPQDADIVTRAGKKASGRLLDGREWNEFPRGRAPS